MEKRYDLSMLVDNGNGCGYNETKTFINVDFEEVMKFIQNFVDTNPELNVTFNVFEGWGDKQKQIRKIVNYKI